MAVAINDHGMVTMVMPHSTGKKITATQFKAHCLRLLDEVAETGETLVVTKHGRPVARIEPPLNPDDLRGSVKINMSDEELIYFSIGPWDMESE
jgi:prevent-host-death family protein